MTTSILKSFLLSCICIFGVGCAFNTEMDFAKTQLDLDVRGSAPLAVAVWDARPYVLDGDKSPEWVGLQRSGYGIPYGVHTDSGDPLAADLVKSISQSLRSSGAQVSSDVSIPPRTKSRGEALQFVRSRTNDTILLITLTDWKSDTMNNTTFNFDFTAEVIPARSTRTTARERIHGSERLVGSMWNPASASEREVSATQKEKLEALLNKPSIRNAMR